MLFHLANKSPLYLLTPANNSMGGRFCSKDLRLLGLLSCNTLLLKINFACTAGQAAPRIRLIVLDKIREIKRERVEWSDILWQKGGRLIIDYSCRAWATYYAITTQRKTQNSSRRGHFTFLEVCCYGISRPLRQHSTRYPRKKLSRDTGHHNIYMNGWLWLVAFSRRGLWLA